MYTALISVLDVDQYEVGEKIFVDCEDGSVEITVVSVLSGLVEFRRDRGTSNDFIEALTRISSSSYGKHSL